MMFFFKIWPGNVKRPENVSRQARSVAPNLNPSPKTALGRECVRAGKKEAAEGRVKDSNSEGEEGEQTWDGSGRGEGEREWESERRGRGRWERTERRRLERRGLRGV